MLQKGVARVIAAAVVAFLSHQRVGSMVRASDTQRADQFLVAEEEDVDATPQQIHAPDEVDLATDAEVV